MSDGGWTRTPRAVWHAAVAGIVGPWPKEVREHDLVVWAEAHIYEGVARPSGRQLAARWGVSHAVARRDIERHEGGAQRGHTESTERAHQEHKGGTLGAHQSQLDTQQPEEKGTERAQRGHTESTERAHQEHKGGTPPPNDAGGLLLFQALEKETETETREGEDKTHSVLSGARQPWARGVKGVTPVEVIHGVTAIVSRIRAKDTPASDSTAKSVMSAYRASGMSWDAFVSAALLVADAAHACPHKLFARDIRAEGWDDGTDRRRDVATIMRHDRWQARIDVATDWDAKGRPKASNGRKPIVNTPIRQMTMQESDDELRAMGIDPDEIPF